MAKESRFVETGKNAMFLVSKKPTKKNPPNRIKKKGSK